MNAALPPLCDARVQLDEYHCQPTVMQHGVQQNAQPVRCEPRQRLIRGGLGLGRRNAGERSTCRERPTAGSGEVQAKKRRLKA